MIPRPPMNPASWAAWAKRRRRRSLLAQWLDILALSSWGLMGLVLAGAWWGAVAGIVAAILATHGIRIHSTLFTLWRGQKTPHELITVAMIVLGYAIAGGYLNPSQWARPGRIERIIDGDTVIGPGGRHIRLTGVDAPELSQPWGQQARECLAHLIGGRVVVIKYEGVDIYGRALARLEAPGPEGPLDLNALLVRKGCAWATSEKYAGEEARARAARRGLWAQERPIPPREWRKSHR